jgi:hypothetical protein
VEREKKKKGERNHTLKVQASKDGCKLRSKKRKRGKNIHTK